VTSAAPRSGHTENMRSVILICLLASSPALAFDYVVEGPRRVRVDVDEELALGGIITASVFYVLPIFVSAVGAASNPDNENTWTRLGLSAPPLVNGALVGTNFIDEMEAQDAKEGWAVIPAGLMWGATLGQAVGLVLVGAAYIGASRVPLPPE